MSEKSPLNPRGLLIAAIVDAINIYQNDVLLPGGHIKDKKQFQRAGSAEGELWNKKYDVAELVADRFLDEISKTIEAAS